MDKDVIEQVLKIAHDAGDEILKVYNQAETVDVEIKKDDHGYISPLTIADKSASEIIVKKLAAVSELPIINEENELSHTINAKEFWLVDPLDGTKEFVNRNGEFTVNIALVKDGIPLFGVVYAPLLDNLYWNDGTTAYKQHGDKQQKITANQNPSEIIAVASRSHSNPDTEQFLADHNITQTTSVGSSLKFCLVAEGKAHVYPRFTPMMLWDTAAANAIATAAGATTVELDSHKPLDYSLGGDLRTPFFVCSSVDLA